MNINLLKLRRDLRQVLQLCLHTSGTARLRGKVQIDLYAPDGTLKEQRVIPNLVVDVGLAHIADQLSDQGEVAMGWMAIGAGTVGPVGGNTALGAELGRVALDSKTQSTADVIYVATFPAGTGTGAVTEAGILNAAAAGVMLCRTVFSVVNKGAGDALILTWTLTISAV